MAGHFLWVLVWTGACYWHGVGGFMFNSSSSPPCAPTNGRPGFPFGFLGAGGRLPKARRGRIFIVYFHFFFFKQAEPPRTQHFPLPFPPPSAAGGAAPLRSFPPSEHGTAQPPPAIEVPKCQAPFWPCAPPPLQPPSRRRRRALALVAPPPPRPRRVYKRGRRGREVARTRPRRRWRRRVTRSPGRHRDGGAQRHGGARERCSAPAPARHSLAGSSP